MIEHMRVRLFVLGTALCLLPGLVSAGNIRIAKCKDAQGRWHYGDNASTACGSSKVTVINKEGMQVKEIDAPLTDGQRRAKEQAQAKQDDEQHQIEERRRKDRLLLATYSSERDILRERDRRLNEIGAQIQASQDTLSTLRATLTRMEAQNKGGAAVPNLDATRAQVQRHQQALAGLQKEQETMKSQFDADLQRFRQLKANPFGRITPAAAPTAAPAR